MFKSFTKSVLNSQPINVLILQGPMEVSIREEAMLEAIPDQAIYDLDGLVNELYLQPRLSMKSNGSVDQLTG